MWQGMAGGEIPVFLYKIKEEGESGIWQVGRVENCGYAEWEKEDWEGAWGLLIGSTRRVTWQL